MGKHEDYLILVKEQLKKAIAHLEYSYNKIVKLPTNPDVMDDEILETWESFCARFSRVADIFLVKFVKVFVKVDDPGFSGTFRDFLNQAEKLDLIDDVRTWMKIRELRNVAAHEYSEQDLENFFLQVKEQAPKLLKIKQLLDKCLVG